MSVSTRITQKNFWHPLFAVIMTLIMCLFVLFVYLYGPFQGSFNQFFMPAEKFGVPSELKAHGITEQYKGSYETGWDGQFYYYIANDPFSVKDTSEHIDSRAYRYQRIGLPLLAHIASKVLGQSWVSPLTYYLTSLIMILMAAGAAANFFQRHRVNPYWILLWAIGCGTQLTLLHGLPDAIADAFLILALISLMAQRVWIYVFTITFAALSREVYILFPAFIFMTSFIFLFRKVHQRQFSQFFRLAIHLIPIFVFIAWRCFVIFKFKVSPSNEAYGVLSSPLTTVFHYMMAGLKGAHPIVGQGPAAHEEGMGIIFFLGLLILSLISSIQLLKISRQPIYIGIALTLVTIIGMYLSFGPTVMMRFTGYFKASNIFVFIIPFIACLTQKKINYFILLFLLTLSLFFDYLLAEQVTAKPYHPAKSIQYSKTQPACLQDFRTKLAPVSIEEVSLSGLVNKLLIKRTTLIQVNVTNISKEKFSPYPGKGAVNLSYQWIKAIDGKVVKEGDRTPLLTTLLPHHSTILPISIYYPRKSGQYFLKLSLVQEGCAWFYNKNRESAWTIPYTVR